MTPQWIEVSGYRDQGINLGFLSWDGSLFLRGGGGGGEGSCTISWGRPGEELRYRLGGGGGGGGGGEGGIPACMDRLF